MVEDLLESLALALEAASLPYMLIGGQAVLFYGEPRLTQDVDVTLGAGPEHLTDLLAVVERLGWEILVKDVAGFVQKTLVLPCMAQPAGMRVDFIFSVLPYEHQAIKRARKVPVGKAQVCYATVEDLIIHKLVAGRPRDLEDVRSVLGKNPDVDLAYIGHWLRQFEDVVDKPLEDQFEEIRNSLA